jgi:hypothetical protein
MWQEDALGSCGSEEMLFDGEYTQCFQGVLVSPVHTNQALRNLARRLIETGGTGSLLPILPGKPWT